MRIYPMIILTFASFSCLAQKETSHSFTVKGKLEKANNTKLYLAEAKKVAAAFYQDSTTTDEAGNFSFTGTIPEPRLFTLAIAGERRMMDRLNFFAEKNAVVSITGSMDSLALAKVSGSEEDLLAKNFAADFNKRLAVVSPENMKPYLAAKAKNDTLAMEREAKIADRKNIDEVANMVTAFVTEHPSSAASIEFIETLFKYSRVSTADSLLEIIETTPAGKYAAAKLLREALDRQKSVMKGATAPDFSLPDTTGHTISLLSLRGKYVLVDFWASWCGPCRAENPNVLKAYHKFKDRNFTVLAVSLDNNKAAWLKAIKDDKLPWDQVSDLKGFDNAAAKKYGVKSIPGNFLIDPAGKIVASNLRGNDLEKALAATLN